MTLFDGTGHPVTAPVEPPSLSPSSSTPQPSLNSKSEPGDGPLGRMDPRSESVQQVIKDGSDELWDQVRARIAAPGGLYFFAKGILLYPDLTTRAHLPLCLFLEDETSLSRLVEYPRRHLKTTLVTVSYTLWRFARTVILGQDPIERIAIVSSTKPNARRFLRQIKSHPEKNQIFQLFLPELHETGRGKEEEDIWNQDEITFARNAVRDAPSIDTFGAGTKATSRHYDGIIEDDMINEENWDSEDAIKKAISLHQLTENLLEDADNSWRITNENSWVQYDLNHHIIENEPDTAVFSVDCEVGLHTERARLLPQRVKTLINREWGDGETVWPERFGWDALRRIRQKVGTFIYNAQYKNSPFDPDVVDFKESWLRRYEWTTAKDRYGKQQRALRIMPRVVRDGAGDIISADPMEVVPLSELYVVAAWDLATDSKLTADRNAMIVTGVDSKERVFILDQIARKSDPLAFMWDVFHTCMKWGVNRCGVEKVGFQRFLISLIPKILPRFNEWWREEQRGTGELGLGVFEPVQPLTGKSKEARIRYLVSVPFENGMVHVRDKFNIFLDEYVHFPKGRTDDCLDAFAYNALLWRPGESEDQQIETEESNRRLLAARDPVTGY